MPTKHTKHSAAASYLGYGLQTVRLCARLLSEPPDATVFVEHDDDVDVHYADGTRLLEQIKRVEKNAVSDWSISLWKTIHNWLADHSPLASSGISRLCLYVTPPQTGDFVSAFHAANSKQDVEALLAKIKAQASKKKTTLVYPFAKRFLDAGLDEQVALATRFQLLCESDPLEAIRAIYAPAVAPELLDKIADFAVGEAKRRTDALIADKLPAGLNAGEFQHKVRLFVQQINLPEYVSFDVPSPSVTQVADKLAAKPVFIRQLELIELEKDTQMNAVSDYLRASACKTRWGAEGVLLPQALDEWESNLVSRHSAISSSIATKHWDLNHAARGKAVYADCRMVGMPLQGKHVPEHFIHGSYNDLADQMRIGWHPNYTVLLK